MLLRWVGLFFALRWWGRIFSLMATVSTVALLIYLYGDHSSAWGWRDLPTPLAYALAKTRESMDSLVASLLFFGGPAVFSMCAYLCKLFAQEAD